MYLKKFNTFQEAFDNSPETQASFSVYGPDVLSGAKRAFADKVEYFVSGKGIMYRISTHNNVPHLTQVQSGGSLTSGNPSIFIMDVLGNVTGTDLTFRTDNRIQWERSAQDAVVNPMSLASALKGSADIELKKGDRIIFSKISTTEILYHTK